LWSSAHEFVSADETVNATFYVQVLKGLRVRHMRSELSAKKNCQILSEGEYFKGDPVSIQE